jgi:catalase
MTPRIKCGFRYNSSDEDNFSQPTFFWRNVLKPDEKERMVENIVSHLKNAAGFIQVFNCLDFSVY